MKTLKRFSSALIAIILAMTMLLPLSVSATVPADKVNEMNFEAYRVLDRDPNTIPVDNAKDNNKVYTVNDDFDDFFKNITPDAYEKGIRNNQICVTVDSSGNLRIVPNTEEAPTENVIILPVNKDVTANSADVLAGVLLSAIESGSGKASDAQILAGWLKNYATAKKNAGGWPVSQTPVTVEAKDGKIDIGDLAYGYWLVYSTNTVNGISNVKVVLEVGEKSQTTIDVKAEYDGLDKTVKNLTDTGKEGKFADTAQADAGDILQYEVKFNIQPLDDYPSNNDINITDLHYVISDTLTNQRLVDYVTGSKSVEGASPYMGVFLLEFNIDGKTYYYADVKSDSINDSLKTSLGLRTTDTLRALVRIRKEQGGINYGTYQNGKQQFSINFDWNSLQDLLGENGATVTLRYKAELTSDAVLQNPNYVELDYSNDPSDHTKSTTHDDTTTVFSYGLDITKTFAGQAGDSTLWNDVVFNLYEASMPAGHTDPADLVQAANPIAFIERTTGTKGDYQRADLGDKAISSYSLKLKADANNLNIYGLDPGYYILEETGSPNGYLLGGKVYIYIKDDGSNALISNGSALWLGLGDDNDISDGGIIGTDKSATKDSLQIAIDNQKRNFQLPDTGDMGVWLFGIGGVLIVSCAAFVYSTAKKKKVSE
ncbi:MAG: LPXTG cell wall anchor domain-containing protein [Eubacterium sp.]|nr:LPXTG cell wall anchor domain-containing protein [Eubacterium sp.]